MDEYEKECQIDEMWDDHYGVDPEREQLLDEWMRDDRQKSYPNKYDGHTHRRERVGEGLVCVICGDWVKA